MIARLLRWLDRRIDARIAADRARRDASFLDLVQEAAADMRAVTAIHEAAAPKRGGDWMGA